MKNKKIASILLAGTILASSTPVYTFAENGNETQPSGIMKVEEQDKYILTFIGLDENKLVKDNEVLKLQFKINKKLNESQEIGELVKNRPVNVKINNNTETVQGKIDENGIGTVDVTLKHSDISNDKLTISILFKETEPGSENVLKKEISLKKGYELNLIDAEEESKVYAENALITINAAEKPEKGIFKNWEIIKGNIGTSIDLKSNPLTFNMPTNNLEIKSVYEKEDSAKATNIVAKAGEKTLTGKTSTSSEVVVKSESEVLGNTTSTGDFTVGLNRELKENEKLTIETTETNKNTATTTYTVPTLPVVKNTLTLNSYTTAKVNGVTISSGSKVDKGSKVIISASSRTGYNFKDWTATGVTVADKNSTVTSFTMPDGDVTITANYTAKPVETNEYELRFDSYVERAEVNGKRVYNRDKIKKGEKVYITAEDRKNYDFDKWDYTSDAYVTIYNSKDRKDAYFYMPSEKVTITPKYTKNEEKDGLKKVYPTKKYKDDRYVEGRLDKYKNTKVYVYYDGREIGSGDTDRDGDYKIRVNKSYTNSQFDDFVYYVDEDNKTKDDLVQVYPKDVELYSKSNGEYRDIKGTLKDEKNRKVYIYLNGNEKGNGSTNSDGKFDFRLSNYIDDKYKENDLKFYVKKELKQVYPKDVELYSKSNGEYRDIKGTLKDYKNEKIYVYLNGNEKGNGSTNSDGKFDFRLSNYIDDKYKENDLKFYIKDEAKKDSKKPIVTRGIAKETKIEGRDAGKDASIEVKDSSGNKLGSTTADKDGKFTVALNRELRGTEIITLIAKESDKNEVKVDYTVPNIVNESTNAYIKGYSDGSFKPNGNMTRAEATVMMARLVNGSDNFTTPSVTKFKDANNAWYSKEINYAIEKGLVDGYPDGTFKPDNTITRAEFAQMIANYSAGKSSRLANFSDITGHWAYGAINKVYGQNVINGYPDGSFKPDRKITRAESVKMLNIVFEKQSSTKTNTFNDVKPSDWFYNDVMKAAN